MDAARLPQLLRGPPAVCAATFLISATVASICAALLDVLGRP